MPPRPRPAFIQLREKVNGQRKLAMSLLGLTKGQLSLLVNDRRKPGRDLAARIEKVYKIPVADWNPEASQPRAPEATA